MRIFPLIQTALMALLCVLIFRIDGQKTILSDQLHTVVQQRNEARKMAEEQRALAEEQAHVIALQKQKIAVLEEIRDIFVGFTNSVSNSVSKSERGFQ